jgi:hypothetical protein
MGTTNFLKDDYYFVAFGREKGGYFDILNLPPDASEEEANEEDRKHRVKLDKDFKTARKEYKNQLEKKEITQEEFDAKVKIIKEEKDQKESELNRLLEIYNAEISRIRKMENEGKSFENLTWHNMYKIGHGNPGIKSLAERNSPLPVIDSEKISRIKKQFLDYVRSYEEPYTPEKSTPPASESVEPGYGPDFCLSDLSELLSLKKTTLLLYADYIWQGLNHEDYLYWLKKINEWIEESKRGLPSIAYKKGKERNAAQDKFSKLHNPISLSIDKFQTDVSADFNHTIKRTADRKDDIWFDFFNDLLAKQNRNSYSPGNMKPEDDLLFKLLSEMMKGEKTNL